MKPADEDQRQGDLQERHAAARRRPPIQGFRGVDPEEAAIALQIRTAIEDGLKALDEQTSPFASDVEPVPGAELQYFDLFDVATGDHIVVWRIERREIVRR